MARCAGKKFEELVKIMATLRGPNGCPWDKEQSYKDINPYMLEEVHEAMESVDKDDMRGLKEELGDLLLHIVFHAQMASEDGHFDINDVIDGICKKMVRRHPHVFKGTRVKNSTEVIERWEKIKKDEGKKSILEGVPTTFPALLKAFRLGEKASRVGFDWTDFEGILEKLGEEIRELHEAKNRKRANEIEHEYGDILFTLANIGRFLKANPEEALRKSANRFIKRFQYMEKLAKKKKLDITGLTIDEWEDLWKKAKRQN